MKQELIVNKVKCCGCGACCLKCPVHCIEMREDEEGFLYPYIDESKCINCGKCKKVCPISSEEKKNAERKVFDIPKAIAGWHKDINVRSKSSSGGAFTLFADYVILNGGVVVGCELNEHNEAVHIYIDKIDDLERIRKSKYVQSNLKNVYAEIDAFLEVGRMVLFVGTPCQVAGLKFYLDKEYSYLYTIDFICHGVPSPMIFRNYLNEIQDKTGNKIVSYSFRNKDHGWNQSGLQLGTKIDFDNQITIRRYPAFKDPYMNGFLSDIYLRPSCYECVFKNIPNTNSDFTIADFWGVGKVAPEMNDGQGTSLILVNCDHAEDMWIRVRDEFRYKEVDFNAAIKKNPTLTQSAMKNSNREQFFRDMQEKGYLYAQKKHMTFLSWFINKLKNVVPVNILQFVKFGLVGVSNTIVSLLVYYIMLYVGLNYLVAYTCGFLISSMNAYYWNSKYVFTNKREKNWRKSAIKSFISYGSTFLFSIVMVSMMVEVLGISEKLAPVLKLFVTIPINFFANKVWAFKDK